MTKIVVIIANDDSRSYIEKLLLRSDYNVMARSYVPDIVDFISKESPTVAIIDGEYFEKTEGTLKERLPKTNLLGWIGKYDSSRAVNLISIGAMDVLCAPIEHQELVGVVGYFSGEFYNKRASDFKPFSKVFSVLKYSLIIFATSIPVIVAIFLFMRPVRPRQMVYDIMTQNPTGISVQNNKIWISDWFTQSINKYDIDSSAVSLMLLKSFYLSDCIPSFLSIVDDNVWTGSGDGTIRKYVVDGDNLSLVEKIPAPGTAPSGLCRAGDFIYTTDSQTNKIYQHMITYGLPVLNTYQYPGLSPISIYHDGAYFYSADVKAGRIYKHLGPQEQFIIVGSYSLSIPGGGELGGIFKDKKNLYVLFASKPSKLMIYPLRTLK